MISELTVIEKLYKTSPIKLLKMSESNKKDNKNTLLAIIEFQKVEVDYGLTSPRYVFPEEKEGYKHLNKARELSEPYSLLLEIYIHDGLAANVKPDWNKTLDLYKKLYEITKDEEIKKTVLDDYKKYSASRRQDYLSDAYQLKIQRLMRASPDKTLLGSLDCAYYDPDYYEEIEKEKGDK